MLHDVVSTGSSEISSTISSLSNNVQIVGSAWILSSALLTTYSTTSFLKYKSPYLIDSKNKNEIINSSKAKIKLTNEEKPSVFNSYFEIQKQISIARPALLTLYRFSGSLLFGIFLRPQVWSFMQRIRDTLASVSDFTLPAVFLFLANYSNSVALDRIGISLTYTSKCGIPLITVILTLLVDGFDALPSTKTLLTLIPIALGIGAASWNSPTFEKIGFISALVSCTAQAALNVSSKKAIRKTLVSGLDAQRAMVSVALVLACAIQFVDLGFQFFASSNKAIGKVEDQDMSSKGKRLERKNPPLGLSLLAVTAYHIEYVLSFIFVKLVEPITYGACDAIRRLTIIITGRKMFGGEPFSRLNITGIGLAIIGALLYSLANSAC